jgi:hypothetical protein
MTARTGCMMLFSAETQQVRTRRGASRQARAGRRQTRVTLGSACVGLVRTNTPAVGDCGYVTPPRSEVAKRNSTPNRPFKGDTDTYGGPVHQCDSAGKNSTLRRQGAVELARQKDWPIAEVAKALGISQSYFARLAAPGRRRQSDSAALTTAECKEIALLCKEKRRPGVERTRSYGRLRHTSPWRTSQNDLPGRGRPPSPGPAGSRRVPAAGRVRLRLPHLRRRVAHTAHRGYTPNCDRPPQSGATAKG